MPSHWVDEQFWINPYSSRFFFFTEMTDRLLFLHVSSTDSDESFAPESGGEDQNLKEE